MGYLYKDYMPGVQSYVNTGNETYQSIDPYTNLLSCIDADHWHVHRGDLFEVSLQFTVSAGDTFDVSFTTPTTGHIHTRNINVNASAGYVTIEYYEDSSVIGGVLAPVYNHNRTVATTPIGTVIISATITAYGTLLRTSYVTGSFGIAGTGGGAYTSEQVEWIDKQDTTYTWHLINESSASNTITFSAYGYDVSE